jgi:hypothetical protein
MREDERRTSLTGAASLISGVRFFGLVSSDVAEFPYMNGLISGQNNTLFIYSFFL